MKKKPQWYYCSTWEQNFYFFIGWKHQDYVQYIHKTYGYNASMDQTSDGGCLELKHHEKGWVYLIWTKGKSRSSFDISTLAHECAHAAHFTLYRRSVELGGLNDEPHCYLMGALIQSVLKEKK